MLAYLSRGGVVSTARLAESDELRTREQERARAGAQSQSFAAVAAQLDDLYGRLLRRRRKRPPRCLSSLA